MRLIQLSPLLLGFAIVGQGVLNRAVGERWGLSAAVVLNATVLLASATAVMLLVRSAPQRFPAFFSPHPSLDASAWWFIFPGMLGCVIVTGVPWAISRFGAAPVFVLVVAGQMVASLAWDALVEGRPATLPRVAGAALAVAGAALVSRG
ncbi:MAG: DMT family transporter [Alphaproteobacteria bacterium]|nr:DMT family transporter [Alphaproteobacteria bacterium]